VLAERVVDHLRAVGVRRVYVSNDIDGTDAYWAAACGTPEPGGLEPEHVLAVLRAVGSQFEILGADLVEVAPGLSLDREAAGRTLTTAASYLRATLAMFERGVNPSL
jgi:agmatinase